MLHVGIAVLCLDDRLSVVVAEEEDVDGSFKLSRFQASSAPFFVDARRSIRDEVGRQGVLSLRTG
jgi:hypothetical protein